MLASSSSSVVGRVFANSTNRRRPFRTVTLAFLKPPPHSSSDSISASFLSRSATAISSFCPASDRVPGLILLSPRLSPATWGPRLILLSPLSPFLQNRYVNLFCQR